MTDEYIEIKNDASLATISEVKALKFDSTFGYPIDETVLSIYFIVNRKTHNPPGGMSSIKMYFSKYNEKYCWQVMADPALASYTYQDTFSLKKNTWYKVQNEQQHNELYFFWNGIKGNYKTIVKPLPGPGPW